MMTTQIEPKLQPPRFCQFSRKLSEIEELLGTTITDNLTMPQHLSFNSHPPPPPNAMLMQIQSKKDSPNKARILIIEDPTVLLPGLGLLLGSKLGNVEDDTDLLGTLAHQLA